MYVIASFEHSIDLELALTALEQEEIRKNQILAIPLNKRTEKRKLFDTIHRSDGLSLFDVGAILGACCMLLGAIYGMVLKWGPILWGLIGLIGGLTLGILLKVLFVKKQNKKQANDEIRTEVFVLIQCREDQSKIVENILWSHEALGVAKLKFQDN
ncbi:hypothetical protein HR057_04150 [Bacillus sp. P2(2020)]|uniref:Uncharacterized protein n=2 Tax=Calidifontibacillus erzurumensis TaxID=2741433 RepID=A0A8J8GFN8_9BACI|nr:hypothetical protein [Calidifontibacillus erzurumensis]